MNIETGIDAPKTSEKAVKTDLLRVGMDGLDRYHEKAKTLKVALNDLAEISNGPTASAARRLQLQLDDFEPSVTMIGQVKAGKTSLVNAMVGWPELLPADVNPWTSVVTSLHMSPQFRPETNSAVFKFFDNTEWARLLERGGRIGELASRAGADDELETVRLQIEQMREKSRARLGKRFELLLGQQHDYGYFDKDLIERYVCLGDEYGDDDTASENQGRYADITKSADIFLHRPEFRTNLCIRDTPGVNDTFMMREQITIRAIRGSRLCVVVLSAHQALSSVDMALIRLISNIKSRDVIIFVNRIDELSDPTQQVPEIRESIRKTLKAHDGPVDADIVFGSAYWANHALSSSLEDLAADSALALVNWAEQELASVSGSESPSEMIWRLSGMPKLFTAISDRIADGAGQDVIDKVAKSAINLANGVQATHQVVELRNSNAPPEPVTSDDIRILMDDIEARYCRLLEQEFEKLIAQFQTRVDRSHRSFLDRATASLVGHMDRYGEGQVWQYDPAGLRVLLRSSYKIFGSRSQKVSQTNYEAVSAELMAIYSQTFGNLGLNFNIKAPAAPLIPPPVFLGQTIALDMQSSWWKGWWQRRRGYQAFASGFFKLIMEETDPLVNELKTTQATSIQAEALSILQQFLNEQREILMNVSEHADADAEDLKEMLGMHDNDNRRKIVEDTLSTLNRYVA
ncbi:MAG: dynamin family protein [Paracoccaceae bacterium]